MARKDIDAVMLAVPDHWHALVATEAAKNKKDIYGEKPLARTIAEQQAIVKAVQKNKRIWQTGSWQRSQAPVPQGGRDRPQRPHRQDHPRRSRLPCHRLRGHPALLAKLPVRPRTQGHGQIVPGSPDRNRVTPSARLDFLDRPLPDGALHQGSRPHELALELQHRRRPVARLDRPPLRHRPLGPGHATTAAPPRSKATASSRPPTPSGTPAPSTASPASIPTDITMIIAGGIRRHPQRHQMDRHRRLGLGGPRRL